MSIIEPKRVCAAKNKQGQPCKAAPLNGHETCIAHADEKTRTSADFGNGPRPGRPRNPRPSEIARRLIESHELALQRPYWRALGYDVRIGPDGLELLELEGGGAKIYGVSAKDGVVYVSEHDDLEAMQRAAERLQDRVYGKPKQVTELTGAEGGPVLTSVLPPEDPAHSLEVASVLSRVHREPAANGNGNGSNGHH